MQLRTLEPVLVLAVLLGASWVGAEFFPFAGDNATPPALQPTHYLYDPKAKAPPAPGACD